MLPAVIICTMMSGILQLVTFAKPSMIFAMPSIHLLFGASYVVSRFRHKSATELAFYILRSHLCVAGLRLIQMSVFLLASL